MEKVKKKVILCYTPSSEPFKIYFPFLFNPYQSHTSNETQDLVYGGGRREMYLCCLTMN
jgi:hypothetical protein